MFVSFRFVSFRFILFMLFVGCMFFVGWLLVGWLVGSFGRTRSFVCFHSFLFLLVRWFKFVFVCLCTCVCVRVYVSGIPYTVGVLLSVLTVAIGSGTLQTDRVPINLSSHMVAERGCRAREPLISWDPRADGQEPHPISERWRV